MTLEDEGPVDDFGPTLATLAYLYPAFFTVFALLLLALVPAGRRVARQCLLAPSSILVYVLFAGGAAVSYLTPQENLGYAIGWLAVLVASVTQFEVEDRGPQPWMWTAFLVIGFAAGLLFGVEFIAEDLPEPVVALPSTVWSWLVVLANVAILGWGLRGLWREHSRHFAGATGATA